MMDFLKIKTKEDVINLCKGLVEYDKLRVKFNLPAFYGSPEDEVMGSWFNNDIFVNTDIILEAGFKEIDPNDHADPFVTDHYSHCFIGKVDDRIHVFLIDSSIEKVGRTDFPYSAYSTIGEYIKEEAIQKYI